MTRIRCSAAALAAACVVAGCGGGGGDGQTVSTSAESPPSSTPTAPAQTATTPAPTTTSPPAKRPSTGSTTPGGTEPARTELTFTGSRSGVRPRKASVAPFVAVRISLVSADRSSHTLSIAGHTLKVGGTRKSEFVELPGLRTGRSYTGKADGRIPIRISASFEPGP